MQPEAAHTISNRWLTCLTVDAGRFGATPMAIIDALAAEDIEARPVWKPMHLQPLYSGVEAVATEVGADLFARGLCLPSGSSLDDEDVDRIAAIVLSCRRSER